MVGTTKLSTLGKTERWLKNPENLPAIPAMVQQAMALLESNSSSVSEVARVIQRDEAIVVKILKVINSAFFGLPRKVNTISEAIALLGFGQTRLLLISAAVLTVGGDRDPLVVYNREFVWQHSMCCAKWTRAIAKHVGYRALEEAFLAGLLHDIGKVVLAVMEPRGFARTLRLCRNDGLTSSEAEQRVLGIDHTQVGEMALKHWNLPLAYRACAALHHDPWPPSIPSDWDDQSKLLKLLALTRAANEILHLPAFKASISLDAMADETDIANNPQILEPVGEELKSVLA
ncbi:MAG: HDOD domain-containing protein [Chloroflexota bacterium]|jgi:putative nucleotidyltransferase with HDIG domain